MQAEVDPGVAGPAAHEATTETAVVPSVGRRGSAMPPSTVVRRGRHAGPARWGSGAADASDLAFDVDPAGGDSVLAFLLDVVRHLRVGRLAVNSFTFLLFVAGATSFVYPFATDLYTEQVVQQRLTEELAAVEPTSVAAWEATAAAAPAGEALTRIAIPALDLDTVVVEGTSPAALRAGAGHYAGTPLPGQGGNVAIAGHRTTYGRPFHRLDELAIGDEIRLSTPVGVHIYRVVAPSGLAECVQLVEDRGACITHPRDWQVIDPTTASTLTLTTCHPKGSARQRLIIRAELVSSGPAAPDPRT